MHIEFYSYWTQNLEHTLCKTEILRGTFYYFNLMELYCIVCQRGLVQLFFWMYRSAAVSKLIYLTVSLFLLKLNLAHLIPMAYLLSKSIINLYINFLCKKCNILLGHTVYHLYHSSMIILSQKFYINIDTNDILSMIFE